MKWLLSLLFLPLYIAAYQYDLTVCAIYNDDDLPYMQEWINFHKKQGVEHFYLYNNGTLANMNETKDVSIQEWNFPSKDVYEWSKIQCGAYLHCMKNISKTARWCAVLDTDEFLFSPMFHSISYALQFYEHENAVGANWVMYGTSHLSLQKDEKLTNKLVMRSEMSFHGNTSYKSIVKPRKVIDCTNPHFFVFEKGCTVNENHYEINGGVAQVNSVHILRINHYWTRDEKFFYEKKIPRRVKWGNHADKLIQSNEEFLNVVYDPILSGL